MQPIRTSIPPKGELLKIQVEISTLLWQKEPTEETLQRLKELWEEESRLLGQEPAPKKPTQSPKFQ